MLSVVIPSYRDSHLQQTIESLLRNARGDIEVVVVLDGYWPETFDWSDPRVKVVHLGENVGLRDAVNAGVRASTGEFIMKADSHCEFAAGYDVALASCIEPSWVVYPVRHYLDTDRWEVMPKAPSVHSKLVIDQARQKFSGVDWRSRDEAMKDVPVSESMSMQGSCWAMRRSRWDAAIGSLETEGYGRFCGEPVEIAFKTWRAGGKLMVCKTTWYAHKHRDFARTHNVTRDESRPSWRHAIDTWGRYYEDVIRPRFDV